MYKKIISGALVIGLVFFGGYLTARQLVPTSSQADEGPRYATKAVERGDIKQGVNVSGQLSGNWGGSITAPRPEGVTDSSGMSVSVTYTVEEVFVEPNQMIKKDDNLVRLSAANLGDILTDLTDSVQKKQEEIQEINQEISRKTKALGDKINQNISSVNDVNPNNGIVISSPIKGRLVDFTVEEGEKVDDPHVATIVDDSMVKISFKVNTYEYSNLQVGQKVLLQYRRVTETGSQTAFDGFYIGTIKKLNSNAVPAGDTMTYVHNGVIEADNPGLVQKGMAVSIFTESDGLPVAGLAYSGLVDSYVNEEKIYTTLFSDGNRSTIIATDVPVSENEFVEAGQVLVRIAGNDVAESIQQDIDSINTEYDKIKVHNEEIEEVYKKIDKVSELTSKLMITAPSDGMISYVNYREGDQITATESSDQWDLMLMDMYNTDEMHIYTTVSDLDVLYIRQDAPVVITVDALPGETFDGKVIRLDQYTDYRDGKTVYNVQIQVEGREGLRPGMNTNCFVDSGESLDTLLVPIEAVFEENGKQKVEILVGENQVEVIEIEAGLMNDMYVEVLSGLEEGQLVVTGSTGDLMPSQSVPENDSFLPSTN